MRATRGSAIRRPRARESPQTGSAVAARKGEQKWTSKLRSVRIDLPTGFYALRAEARRGISASRKARDRLGCRHGTFDREGEALFAARVDGVLVGIGGITIEPVVPGALRMRRFYVRPAFRQAGVGGKLAMALLAGVRPNQLITINAAPRSIPFWKSIGFTADQHDGHTHTLNRESARLPPSPRPLPANGHACVWMLPLAAGSLVQNAQAGMVKHHGQNPATLPRTPPTAR